MRKFLQTFLCVFALFSHGVAIAVQAEESQLFSCPHLQDETRRTLVPVTQGKAGWFFRESDLKSSYQLLLETRDYLARLAKVFAAKGTQLILLPVPPRSLAAPQFLDPSQPMQKEFDPEVVRVAYEDYLTALRDTGIKTVGLLGVMEGYDPEHDLYFFFRRDHHWTPFGAELAAQQAGELLKTEPAYKPEATAEYATEITETLKIKHTLAQEIQRLCTDKIPPEPYPQHVTTVQEEKGEQALFGDVSAAAPLVLLGSSFSAQELFNFAGFLSQETGLEVANYAISAGQLFNAIVSYTSLPEAERLQPDFVLWEALAHYDFNNNSRLFRQIIPAVQGECSADEAVAVRIMRLDGKEKEELFDLQKAKDVTGSGYFLFLHIDDRSLAKFTLEMEYDDGDGEWFTVDRSEHFNNTGRFFIELTDEISSALTRITMDGLGTVHANLEARLCRYPVPPPPEGS